MKKYSLIQAIILFTIIVIIVSACTLLPQQTDPTPQATFPPTQPLSPTPAATEVPISIPGLQPITPENIQNMELLYELGVGHSYDAALSPDGKNIAVLTKYKIIVYDRDTFKEKFSVPVEIPSNSAITFSPDGEQIVYSNTQAITFLDAKDGTDISGFPLGSYFDNIDDIIFIPENDRIFVIGLNADSHFGTFCFMLFDLQGHKLFDREYSNREWKYLLQYINKHRTALLIYQNGGDEVFPLQTFIIDNETGNVLTAEYKVRRYEQPIEETIIGMATYLPSQAEIEQWVETHETIPSEKQIPDCSVLPKYSRINVLAKDEKTALLEFKEDSYIIDNTNIRIEEIDLQTCKLIRHIDIPSVLNDGIFSPNDRFFVENNEFSTYVWDLSDGSMWLEFPGQLSAFPDRRFLFTSDGDNLLIGPDVYDNDSITIYDLDSANIQNKMNFSGGIPFPMQITFLTDVILFNNEIWNINTIEHIADLPHGPLLLDPGRNGVWILTYNGKSYTTPELYNLATGELIKEFFMIQTNSNPEMRLIDGDSILEISFDGKSKKKDYIQIDIATGKMLASMYNESPPEDDHSGYQGTEQSQYLFSESDNKDESYKQASVNEIVGQFIIDSSTQHPRWTDPKWHSFWKAETGQYLGFFRTNFSITNFMVSPNQYFLAAIGSDGIIRIFGVKEE